MMMERDPSLTESDAQRLSLHLPAHHLAARRARQEVRAFAERCGLESGDLDPLEFVAGELLSNAVDHGGGDRAMDEDQWNGQVHVRLELIIDTVRWRLQVDDQGGGDPEEVRALLNPPDDVPDLEDERGRGFFLLMAMLDSLDVAANSKGDGVALIAAKRTGAAD